MDTLVLLEGNDMAKELYTTSHIIAEKGQVEHDTLKRLIRNHESDLMEFGKVGYQIQPTERNQGEKIYHLNEQQATLIITYMKNTLPVREFKKVLVKEFYRMRSELEKRRATRYISRDVRESLTAAINLLPESPHKTMKYKHYTDLAYQSVFGKATKQLREERGVPKNGDLRNRFTSEELEKVLNVENKISVLVGYGMEYKTIKGLVLGDT
jgi:phage regulator Rha-like protein